MYTQTGVYCIRILYSVLYTYIAYVLYTHIVYTVYCQQYTVYVNLPLSVIRFLSIYANMYAGWTLSFIVIAHESCVFPIVTSARYDLNSCAGGRRDALNLAVVRTYIIIFT